MTVLLVLMTFVTFLLIDHFHSRGQVVAQPAVQPLKREAPPRLAPSLVGGFQVPDKLRFHPGHTWALSESPSLVRIGIDEFASKLTGKLERIGLPQRGQWIRQGQKVWTLHRDGTTVDMVSPIEGSHPTQKRTSATCWGAHWPAGGRKSRPAVCSGACRWRSEPWRRMVALPWTISPRKFPTRNGPPWRKSSSCRSGPHE
jgi:hypothetical protein